MQWIRFLASALEIGACSARIVLDADVLPEGLLDDAEMTRIGKGEDTEAFAYLDPQILEIGPQPISGDVIQSFPNAALGSRRG